MEISQFVSNLNSQLSNNNFKVWIGVMPIGEFTKVSGLGYNISPFVLEEGGRNHSAHYRPFDKPGEHTAVTLSWGAVKKADMQAWVHSVAPGHYFRKMVFITHHARDGGVRRIYILNGAWPKEWKVEDLDANGNEIATESLTLVCESVFTISIPL